MLHSDGQIRKTSLGKDLSEQVVHEVKTIHEAVGCLLICLLWSVLLPWQSVGLGIKR